MFCRNSDENSGPGQTPGSARAHDEPRKYDADRGSSTFLRQHAAAGSPWLEELLGIEAEVIRNLYFLTRRVGGHE